MLGNFSFGDYFETEAIGFAWDLSREVFGFPEESIWVTVFEGDEALGLGPDEEAIDAWLAVGVPRERIVACPRKENFWSLALPARAARARSCTSTAASHSERRRTSRAARTSASSSTGTSSS